MLKFQKIAFPLTVIAMFFGLSLTGCLNSRNGALGPSSTGIDYSGFLITTDTFFKVELVQGSWNNPIAPWVAESTDPTLPADGNTRIGNYYVFGPSGVTTLKPVTITLVYDPATLPAGADPSTLRLYTLVNNTWVVADTAVDPTNKSVTIAASTTNTYRLAVDGGAASLALNLTVPATDPSISDSTRLAWSLADNTVNQAGLTCDCAIFSADSDRGIVTGLSITGLTDKKSGITAIVRAGGVQTHGLATGSAYFWGSRARSGNSIGPWARRAFTYVKGPAVTGVTVCNLTDTSATVFWRTDADAVGSRVYFAFDGQTPVSTGLSAAEDNTISNARVHVVNLNWAGETHGAVKFYIISGSTAVAGITTVEDNGGSYLTFAAGEAFVPPVAPELIVINTSGMADGTLVSCILEGVGKSTFPYLATVSSDRLLLVHNGTRWNDSTSSRITETLSILKVSNLRIHFPGGSSTVSGTFNIDAVNGVFTVDSTISPVAP